MLTSLMARQSVNFNNNNKYHLHGWMGEGGMLTWLMARQSANFNNNNKYHLHGWTGEEGMLTWLMAKAVIMSCSLCIIFIGSLILLSTTSPDCSTCKYKVPGCNYIFSFHIKQHHTFLTI
jgi:hypothetical protein